MPVARPVYWVNSQSLVFGLRLMSLGYMITQLRDSTSLCEFVIKRDGKLLKESLLSITKDYY